MGVGALAVASCDAAPTETYADVKSAFSTCGENDVMFVTHWVSITMPDDSVLDFCNSKKLSYTIAEQAGVLSASIAVAAREGVDAAVALQSLRWESCTGGHQQAMVLDLDTNYNGVPTLNIASNNYLHDSADSNLAAGAIVLRSSCVDVCSDPAQLTAAAVTDFSIVMGGASSVFQISSQIQGNPCEDSDSIDAIPAMQLKIEDAGSNACTGSMPAAASATAVAINDKACFHVGLLDSNTDVTSRKLSMDGWSL